MPPANFTAFGSRATISAGGVQVGHSATLPDAHYARPTETVAADTDPISHGLTSTL